MAGQEPILVGFGQILDEADAVNRKRRNDRAFGHLPDTMEDAVRFHRGQIKAHNAAMLAADIETARPIRRDAHAMAVRVNHGEPGILASNDAPGCVLETRCAAHSGRVPLWGQRGRFTINLDGLPIRIGIDGMFGISGTYAVFPGFSAHAVEHDRPFISETGFRSFLGATAAFVKGITPESFVAGVIAAHVRGELKGKLRAIGPRHGPAQSSTPTDQENRPCAKP